MQYVRSKGSRVYNVLLFIFLMTTLVLAAYCLENADLLMKLSPGMFVSLRGAKKLETDIIAGVFTVCLA